MIVLALIGLVGGLITGISPCILPVLPVILVSGGAQSLRTTAAPAPGTTTPAPGTTTPGTDAPGTTTSGRTGTGTVLTAPARPVVAAGATGRRPYLVVGGLALSFSVFTLLGTLVLRSLPVPQDIIRWAGLVILVLLGLGMMLPRLESLLERPFSRIPQRRINTDRGGFVLGLALGTVYVPCAGPVLAAITVAGATGRIGGHTLVLTVAFAVGTAIPLLVFALAGRRVAERVQGFRRHQRRVRIGSGVLVIALAAALTFNVTDAVQRAIPDYTTSLDNALNKAGDTASVLGGKQTGSLAACAQQPATTLQNCGTSPSIAGIQQWLNTPGGAPLTLAGLKGKVVLVDFWAYSCINCQRAITHVEPWYKAYSADGLVVIGVHTPEYAFEHTPSNVAAGAKRLGITYPVALDNDYGTWNNFDNQSWPAEYLIDSTGQVRHVGIGEGEYPTTENLIRQLLTAANPSVTLPAQTEVADTTPTSVNQTPETYLGSDREQMFNGASYPSGASTFTFPAGQPVDSYTLSGRWTVGKEAIRSGSAAAIRLNYDASDVYLDVGGTGTLTTTVNGTSSTIRVSGAPNIYTVAHATSPSQNSVEIALSPGLSAYSFTYG